jgi:hypothetical protein
VIKPRQQITALHAAQNSRKGSDLDSLSVVCPPWKAAAGVNGGYSLRLPALTGLVNPAY